ncbi:hypothetical protein J3458_021366 [Metarhizium acridum]|uniref:uncharacterized protein n=1 Tax=Metarhizium acridum TaxID=92637 RepID=UPI001C6C1115|nr:hypothetical protein J3458_021366 [Metarhizium acridum]
MVFWIVHVGMEEAKDEMLARLCTRRKSILAEAVQILGRFPSPKYQHSREKAIKNRRQFGMQCVRYGYAPFGPHRPRVLWGQTTRATRTMPIPDMFTVRLDAPAFTSVTQH